MIGERLASEGLILMYHRIAEVNPDPFSLCVSPRNFSEHLEVLKSFYRTIQLKHFAKDMRRGNFAGPTLALTFDDGYADNLYSLKPILERYDIPATVFLTTGSIGSGCEFWWDELERIFLGSDKLPDVLHLCIKEKEYKWNLGESAGLSDDKNRRQNLYMEVHKLLHPQSYDEQQSVLQELRTWAGIENVCRPSHCTLTAHEVAALAEGGLVEIGSHSVTHRVFTASPEDSLKSEITESKRFLEELTGAPVSGFTYPYGIYTKEALAFVREAGYAYACSASMTPRIVEQNTDPFLLPRVMVEDWTGDEFSRRLSEWFKL